MRKKHKIMKIFKRKMFYAECAHLPYNNGIHHPVFTFLQFHCFLKKHKTKQRKGKKICFHMMFYSKATTFTLCPVLNL